VSLLVVAYDADDGYATLVKAMLVRLVHAAQVGFLPPFLSSVLRE